VSVKIRENVPLAKLTTIGTGGPARFLAEPESVEDLVDVLSSARAGNLPVAVVGLGSNVLAADEGFPGLVVRLKAVLAMVKTEEETMMAGGGAPLAVCLHRARAAGLGGIEFACAIPGTVGGAVRMNAGAHGGDLASVLARALVADARGARWRTPAELGLAYRRSGLAPGEVVAGVELRLVRSDEETIRERVAELQRWRKETQPTDKRTFGSVFKNPDGELTAGRMLDACGLRGHRIGDARISPKHANFIENAGKATTADALALVAQARQRALERFGVVLEPEVQLLGPIEIPPLDGV
jgi:UDP-N-acetylmuramate dehydrogenase